MLGHAAIAEVSFSDTLGVVKSSVLDVIGTSSKSSIGVGILAGSTDIDANFTQTTISNFTSSGVSDISANFTQTTENIKRVTLSSTSLNTSFTKTSVANSTFSASTTNQFSFTKTTSGDILFVEINKGKTPAALGAPTYTEVSPTGVETWTEITPSGTETYTEIEA